MDLYLEVIGTHQRASFDQKNEKICVFTRCLSGKRNRCNFGAQGGGVLTKDKMQDIRTQHSRLPLEG